jgi:hypothetical protein
VRHRSLASLSVLAAMVMAIVLWTACQDAPDTPQRSAPVKASRQAAQNARRLTLDDMFDELALELPGFGGLYLNDAGELVVRFVGGRAPDDLRMRIQGVMGVVPGRPGGSVHVVDAKYDFHALRTFASSILRTTPLPDYSMLDINESRNTVVLGLPDAASLSAIKDAVRSLPIPQDAMEFVLQAPMRFLSTLQDSTNPLSGAFSSRRDSTLPARILAQRGSTSSLPQIRPSSTW